MSNGLGMAIQVAALVFAGVSAVVDVTNLLAAHRRSRTERVERMPMTPRQREPSSAKPVAQSWLVRFLAPTAAVGGLVLLPFLVIQSVHHIIKGEVDGYAYSIVCVAIYVTALVGYVDQHKKGRRTGGHVSVLTVLVIVIAMAGAQRSYDLGNQSAKDVISAFLGWLFIMALPAFTWVMWKVNGRPIPNNEDR